MPFDLSLEILPSELTQIVESVFATMLGLEVASCEIPWVDGPDRLTAAVNLSGAWNGAVLFECDRRQACRLAARFLSIDAPEPQPIPAEVDDMVRDLIGELANMIGGNLKCVLTHGARLSMPSVVDGSESSIRFCKTQVTDRLSFQTSDGIFWITVLTMFL